MKLANRFLGLEAQVTQENFYFNATKVTLLQKNKQKKVTLLQTSPVTAINDHA